MGQVKNLLDEREFAKNNTLDEQFRDAEQELLSELEKVAEEENKDDKYEGLKPEDDIYAHPQGDAD